MSDLDRLVGYFGNDSHPTVTIWRTWEDRERGWTVRVERRRPGTRQAYDRAMGSGPTFEAAVADLHRTKA